MENEATAKTPIPTRSGFSNFALCTLIFAFSTYLSCHEFIASEPPFLSRTISLCSLPSLWLFPWCLRVSVAISQLCKTNPILLRSKPTQPLMPQTVTPIFRSTPPPKNKPKQTQSSPAGPQYAIPNTQYEKQTQSHPLPPRRFTLHASRDTTSDIRDTNLAQPPPASHNMKKMCLMT